MTRTSAIRPSSPRSRRRRRQWSMVTARRLEMSGGRCEAGITGVCTGAAEHGHHVRLRSQGGADTIDNCRALCRWCHDFVHRNVAWAVERGFIVRGEVRP